MNVLITKYDINAVCNSSLCLKLFNTNNAQTTEESSKTRHKKTLRKKKLKKHTVYYYYITEHQKLNYKK